MLENITLKEILTIVGFILTIVVGYVAFRVWVKMKIVSNESSTNGWYKLCYFN